MSARWMSTTFSIGGPGSVWCHAIANGSWPWRRGSLPQSPDSKKGRVAGDSGYGMSYHLVVTTKLRVPVLISGAGAGGLATSALLGQHGVGSLLVEKRRELFLYPKARNLSFRSLEILRGLGLSDEVHAVAEHVSEMVTKPTLNSAEEKPAIDIDAIFAGLELVSPEPVVQYCPQSRLEPIL